jgi:hypothetical protein
MIALDVQWEDWARYRLDVVRSIRGGMLCQLGIYGGTRGLVLSVVGV